jgi:hypothetical protein
MAVDLRKPSLDKSYSIFFHEVPCVSTALRRA